MKKIASLIAFLILIAALRSARAQCHGQHQQLVQKDDTLIVPCTDMVLLNMQTFETYYLANKNLESIKKTMPQYEQLRDSLESQIKKQTNDFKSIIEDKTKAIQLESMNKQDALNHALRLEAVNQRLKKGHKVKNIALAGAGSFILAFILVGQSN